MAGAYKYRPQYTQNTLGPDGGREQVMGEDDIEAWRRTVEKLYDACESYRAKLDKADSDLQAAVAVARGLALQEAADNAITVEYAYKLIHWAQNDTPLDDTAAIHLKAVIRDKILALDPDATKALAEHDAALRHPLFVDQVFTSHSGVPLDWKIDCDALTDAELSALANRAKRLIDYGSVIPIPTGGARFSKALEKYRSPESANVLIVDDVLTTGKSMEQMRHEIRVPHDEVRGVVIFARGPWPAWVTPLFVTGETANQAVLDARVDELTTCGLVHHKEYWTDDGKLIHDEPNCRLCKRLDALAREDLQKSKGGE